MGSEMCIRDRCNADEGDSGTFSDRMIMENDPFVLIEGMIIAGIAVGAETGYIYLRSEYPDAQKVLNKAIQTAKDNGFLGSNILGSKYNFNLEVTKAAGAYICGEETSLLESLEGKRGMVRYKPPLPAIEGLYGQPTVVNNVITLATVPIILDKGLCLKLWAQLLDCLLYTSPSPRDLSTSRMPSSA